ncbi:hypothetical protein AALO_G00283470 [Alosa alosa]|uniref:Uncharacterized protein n=1 Tax=Alosa alosa TaxID=278164 RepID=A0AAV6FJY3_9TELE|nr:hypothetical protein AALO_G00283470 [Alosa alosa]
MTHLVKVKESYRDIAEHRRPQTHRPIGPVHTSRGTQLNQHHGTETEIQPTSYLFPLYLSLLFSLSLTPILSFSPSLSHPFILVVSMGKNNVLT